MYIPAIILAALPMALGHMGLWDPSGFEFDGDGYSLVTPMSGLPFNQWWFHGVSLDKKPSGPPMSLPAGGKVNVQLACNKEFTEYGTNPGNDLCPTDIDSIHAGNPIDPSHILGCGLAIAYVDDLKNVKPADLVIFSVNDNCPTEVNTSFDIPAGMPACPNGKCICAWFWQGQDSDNEMYMTGFECKVDGATSTIPVGKGVPPKYCGQGSNTACVMGPKQPMYWANDSPNIQFSGDYFKKPSYNSKWGFSNGAQNDIFGGTPPPYPPPQPTSPPPQPSVPGGGPSTFITLTSSKIAPSKIPSSKGGAPAPAPTPAPKCSWEGHCAGAACGNDDDCSDDLTCQSRRCA